MIVGPPEFFAVLPTMEEANAWTETKSKPLHEILEVFDVERATNRKVLVVISQGDKAVVVIE